ncbi:MAG: P-loop NTPase fold protein [Pseudobacter sp.]|uniref:P-loop NTPase fold protein n=1 Tax=Pseudobacter sp. TaxID=2045420 RepID=UPI003F7D02D6
MSSPYFEDIFHFPCKEFSEHLENKSNERIFFSGRYGIGKTQFLKDFFKQESIEAKYDVYHLFPIDYSITANEDIIRYLKYDIINELLLKNENVDEERLGFLKTVPKFILNNLHKVTASIIHMIPKIGKDVVESFERIDKLKEEFLKFHDDENVTETDKMIMYLEKLEAEEGGIYENDLITKIITSFISSTKKQTVLILDDLDRIDPEHVFRILNVFASHFDKSGTGNKFGFNKIILVCDNKNMRSIYQHKYGIDADYSGYIDKFYSNEVYHFDNINAIQKSLNKIFNSIDFRYSNEQELLTIRKVFFGDNFLNNIITMLLNRSYINLRSIVKLYSKSVNYHYNELNILRYNSSIASWKIPITAQYKILRDIAGDYTNLKKILLSCLNYGEVIKDYDEHFCDALFVLSVDKLDRLMPQNYVHDFKGILINVSLYTTGFSSHIYQTRALKAEIQRSSSERDTEKYSPSIEQFWSAHIAACDKLHRLGYL